MNIQEREELKNTYNKGAKEFSKYFQGIGSRNKDIEDAFAYFNYKDWEHLNVVEIGCGDGRDAKEIVKKTSNYVGIDISEEMVRLARKFVPETKFEVADLLSYSYDKDIDIIFAFASVLHCDRSELGKLFQILRNHLSPSGIIFLSLKEDRYHCKTKMSPHGKRTFCYYQKEDIQVLADGFELKKSTTKKVGDSVWLDTVLQISSS